MWVSDIDIDGATISGTLLNEPQWVAFTVNVMRSHMSPAERIDLSVQSTYHHDNAWGFDFGDPNMVNIVGYPVTPEIEFDRQEHPMSENIAKKMDEALTQSPAAVTQQDSDGWTMLHREALAGNLAPIRILLNHGADPTVRNESGNTALDLACKMGWPNIVELLENAEDGGDRF